MHPETAEALLQRPGPDQAAFDAEVDAALARLRRLIASQEAGLTCGRLEAHLRSDSPGLA